MRGVAIGESRFSVLLYAKCLLGSLHVLCGPKRLVILGVVNGRVQCQGIVLATRQQTALDHCTSKHPAAGCVLSYHSTCMPSSGLCPLHPMRVSGPPDERASFATMRHIPTNLQRGRLGSRALSMSTRAILSAAPEPLSLSPLFTVTTSLTRQFFRSFSNGNMPRSTFFQTLCNSL